MSSNVTGSASGLISLGIVWAVASAVGFLVMAALMLLADWTLLPGLFAAAIVLFVIGAALSVTMLKPLSGPVEPGSAGVAPGSVEEASAPAPATPSPSPATAPLAATTEAAAPAPEPAPAPETASPEPEAVEDAGTRPAALDGPRDGGADDLKKIKGIGPKLEKLCNSLGFYHFDQIAAWTADEVAWVDQNLEGFKGRVSRDVWVEQAKQLAAGGETEFSRKVDKGDVY